MNERLLQFIWQFQYFNKTGLHTADGDPLTIIHPGIFNTNQGPDFLEGKIVLDNTTWVGNIELHLKSSDWNRHGHGGDANYSNVILHVVWEHDADIHHSNGAKIPVFIMQHLVAKVLLERYGALMEIQPFVPCQNFLPAMDEMKWTSWKERIASERLQRKSLEIIGLLKETNNNWEEIFWWRLARNFGIKTNADIFEGIARSIPVNLLAKHKHQIHQMESLLLGQAGLLNHDFEEDYPQLLKKEYIFLQKKYGLKQNNVRPYFLRMRPANFPTIRLAQLAMLIHYSTHLFSKVKEAPGIEAIADLLNVTANDYWHYHFKLDELSEYQPKQLGKQMTDNIIINTVVPILFAYGMFHLDEMMKEKALGYLEQLSAEKNAITTKWKQFGVKINDALQSQALIELKNVYCNNHKCLECSVGNIVLRNNISQ